MSDQKQSKSSGCNLIFFAGFFLFLFTIAEVFDDVRHGRENLFLFFIYPFLIGAVAASLLVSRSFWNYFPQFTPRYSPSKFPVLSVGVSVLISLALTFIWIKLSLFDSVYHSVKCVLLIILSGLFIGLIHRAGRFPAVLASLLCVAISTIAAFPAFFAIGLLFGAREGLWRGIEIFTPMGIPYVIAIAFYDCYLRASHPLHHEELPVATSSTKD